VDDSPLPDWMRPDQCGAIVLLNQPWNDIRVVFAVPVGETIPDRTLDWLKAYAVKYKRPWLYHQRLRKGAAFTGLKRFGFGPPEFRKTVAALINEGAEDLVGMISC
jgi:hypothetical protein